MAEWTDEYLKNCGIYILEIPPLECWNAGMPEPLWLLPLCSEGVVGCLTLIFPNNRL